MTNGTLESTGSQFAQFSESLRQFVKLETAGGVALMAATIAAMIVSNSPLAGLYQAFLMIEGAVSIGPLSVEKPLFLWVNDLWMAIFFFLVGMEIKKEVLEGHLADRSQIVLPAAAAVGGMAVPAAIYLLVNGADPAGLQGWAVPTATDIAFALGVLSLLGSRVPTALRIFLLTLAILDDLGAIVVIAFFYTANLSALSLMLAALALGVLIALNAFGVTRIAAFVITGAVMWVCVLKSGVHATLAGVLTGLAIPLAVKDTAGEAPLDRLLEMLHPWVAFAILPMFAFVNTGLDFRGIGFDAIFGPVPLGIALGLLIGKPLGVFGASWLMLRLGLSRLPANVSLQQIFGTGALCGIGFTMSLFIGGLAFAEGGSGYASADRLGILAGSLASGLLGYLILRFTAASRNA
jgi:NhaA family Na+:H+ antiporter